MVDAEDYARSISKEVAAVYVELAPGSGERIREKWQRWWPDVPLVVLPSPYRSIVGPLLSRQRHLGYQRASMDVPYHLKR